MRKSLSNIIRPILLVISLILAFACDDTDKKEEQSLKKSVLEIHDEVMPQMQVLEQMKEKLLQIEAELVDDNTEDHADEVAQIQNMAKELTRSGEAMMTWMREYEPQIPEDMEHEQAMTYLESEKEKIESVRTLIQGSIAAADSLIKSFGDEKE